jgi:hypothetical protein
MYFLPYLIDHQDLVRQALRQQAICDQSPYCCHRHPWLHTRLLVTYLQNGKECLLWNLNTTDLLHAFFTRLLLFQ